RPHKHVKIATSRQTINRLPGPTQSHTHPVILRRHHRRHLTSHPTTVVIRLTKHIPGHLLVQLRKQTVHQAIVVIRQTRHTDRLDHGNTTALRPPEDLPTRADCLPFCDHHNANTAA